MIINDFDLSNYTKELEYLVNIDSGSYDADGVAKVAEFFIDKFSTLGWKIKSHEFSSAAGPCLEITNSNKDYFDIMFMGHMDTVFKTGEAAERPFTIRDGKGYGPGIIDCKAGLLYTYYVLSELHNNGKLDDTSICVAFNCDEEISSIYSRSWLEDLSKKSDYVLVVEAARADGSLVNKRKGVGRYKLEINGVAAHSGVDHQKGRSAIEELAHWIHALHSKTNYATGTTVNVGVISGGSAVNVVAEQAKAEVDIRFYDMAEAEAIDKLLKELAQKPKVDGITAKVTGGITRPPMIPSEKTLALCEAASAIGSKLGIGFGWTATGGGSDGSFAAVLGITTIDGLGPVGGGAHGSNEYLELESIKPRYYLLRDIVNYIITNMRLK